MQDKRSPLELHEEEKPYLIELPAIRFDTAQVVYRKVDSEGFINYADNRYSAPWRLYLRMAAWKRIDCSSFAMKMRHFEYETVLPFDVFLPHGIFGVHAGNCGAIEVKNSEISVTFKYAEERSTGFPTQLLIVPWGDAYFLVPKGRIHGFCLAARESKPFLLSTAYCLEKTRPTKLEGLPSIPEKYNACLSSDAIKTHIINAKKATIETLPSRLLKITQTVSLDCGEQVGVYLGMEFESLRPHAVLTVTSLSLDKAVCTGTFECIEHPLSEIADGLAIGMVFRTARN